MRSRRWVRTADATLYAVAVTVVALAVGVVAIAALALGLRGTLSGVRWLYGLQFVLFILGFLTLGLGAWKLRPEPPGDRSSRLSIANSRRETAFQRAVRRVPPLRGVEVDADERFSDGTKLLIAGVAMLAAMVLLGILQAGA